MPTSELLINVVRPKLSARAIKIHHRMLELKSEIITVKQRKR